MRPSGRADARLGVCRLPQPAHRAGFGQSRLGLLLSELHATGLNSSHAGAAASDWVTRWAHLAAPDANVLDIACGSGRHLRWWAQRGHTVTGIDRDAAATQGLAALGELVLADLENAAWPLPGRQFGVVVVTHYLWRPLLPEVLSALAPGGLLLYETFSQRQAQIGRPRRPEFLLAPGELLQVCSALETLAFEDVELSGPQRFVQRIAARRPASPR
jgi:SAM-dependent methyltransferase